LLAARRQLRATAAPADCVGHPKGGRSGQGPRGLARALVTAQRSAACGDYIKTNTSYKLHVNAAVAGSCLTYAWQGECIPAFLYKHTAVRTDQTVASHPSTLIVLGALNVQSYNTCINANGTGNCTSAGTLNTGGSWMAPRPGVYVYSADNVAGGGTTGPGQCNMTHSYPSANSITLHALACVPY
jgi:hypothetical protein